MDLGGYGDALGGRHGLGNGETVFAEACNVDRDAFTDELFGVFTAIADYTETGEIRSVSSPTAVVGWLEDDKVLAHWLLQTRLPQNTLARAFWYIFSRLACNRYAARFGWVFVLLMATNGIVESPAVLFDELDDLTKFHF